MRSHIKKALRIKGHQFFLANDEEGNSLTKIKTKKRMHELTNSIKFIDEIYKIDSNFRNNLSCAIPGNSTVIFRKRKS